MGEATVRRVTPDEVRALRARGENVMALDVRTSDARALLPREIPGARWLPLHAVVAQAAALPRDATIVAYCT